jgi:hypothetical protein
MSKQKELEKVQEQCDSFEKNVKDLTMDRLNQAPRQETEPQTKLSSKEIAKSSDIYLKPEKIIASRDKFNEKFRDSYDFDKEYVHFIAENKEIIGEAIELWTRPYGGMPAEYWRVPTNKPVWGPRYLAEQIKRKFYHRLVMQQNVITETNHAGQMFGCLAADTTIQRLDAHSVSSRKSASSF